MKNFFSELLPFIEQAVAGRVNSVQRAVEQFASPLQGRFPVTQKFGNYNPGLYGGITKGAKHLGVDLAAPEGTSVFSPIGGIVKRGNDKNWGNYVTVIGDDGTEHQFSHLSGLNRIGDRINAGQEIGRTGSTGNSTGPHLDISVRRGGQYVDPMTLEIYKRFLMGGES